MSPAGMAEKAKSAPRAGVQRGDKRFDTAAWAPSSRPDSCALCAIPCRDCCDWRVDAMIQGNSVKRVERGPWMANDCRRGIHDRSSPGFVLDQHPMTRTAPARATAGRPMRFDSSTIAMHSAKRHASSIRKRRWI